MHAEERGLGSIRLYDHQGLSWRFPAFLPNQLRHLFNRGSLKDTDHRQISTQRLIDMGKQFDCKQRMTAQVKEIVLHTHSLHLQQRLPDPGELKFQTVAGWTIAV